MNFLTPLFLVGALAIAGPIVFHLIRRAARERMPFSSLMFLKPTAPRTVRRQKLEHPWLLLLRCLCIALIAAAFARPFFSKDIRLPDAETEGRRIILLVDTSASMRRNGLWDAARAIAGHYLNQSASADEIAVMTFDRRLHTLISFDEWSAWSMEQRTALAKQKLDAVSPGWMGTQLGLALTGAAEQFPPIADAEKNKKTRAIILISDLQEGAKLDGLQGHDWPANTRVVLERVDGKKVSNAGLEILEQSPAASDAENGVQVRVANSGDSTIEKFHLQWTDVGAGALDIYLPPGQSRTFTAPKLPAGTKAAKLQLSGDDVDFDNVSYYAAPEVQDVTIAYFGDDMTNDSTKMRYYLERVFSPTARRKILIAGKESLAQAAFAILPGKLTADESAALRSWMGPGKTALFVLTGTDSASGLASLLDVPTVQVSESGGDFALLGEIDFKHPIFAPFDDPRFSDFSRIHFWKHRIWEIPPGVTASILAQFDDKSPALAQISVGKGHLLVLASGWDPADSQLAVSSKFPPLMQTMLQWSGSAETERFQFHTGDSIPSPVSSGGRIDWQKPGGKQVTLATGTSFVDTDTPGIYQANCDSAVHQFAVNLPLEESRLAPMPQDELARLGVPLGALADNNIVTVRKHQQQLQETELENRQKIWRWLLAAALALALGEILLGGWLAQRVTVTEATT